MTRDAKKYHDAGTKAVCVCAVVAAVLALQPVARIQAASTGDDFYASCQSARKIGVTPLYKWEPGYRMGLDPDKNGIACEP
jgi:hypothetical protein